MLTRETLESYFDNFHLLQVAMCGVGSLVLIAAILLYVKFKGGAFRGYALPAAVFGFFVAGAGAANLRAENELRVRAAYNFSLHPDLLKVRELSRINELLAQQYFLLYLCLALAVTAIFIWQIFKTRDRFRFQAQAAISLSVMAVLCAAFSFSSIRIAEPYQRGINSLPAKMINKGNAE